MENENKVEEVNTVEKSIEGKEKDAHIKEDAAVNDKNRRIEECGRALSEVFKKYACDLDVSMILKAGQVIPSIRIIAVEDRDKRI